MRQRRIGGAALAFALATGGPLLAQEDAGAYLAGRAAALAQDYAVGAEEFARALRTDPDNPALLQYALANLIGVGRPLDAVAPARQLESLGGQSVASSVVLQAAAFADGDYETALARLDDGASVSPVIDGLARGWAHLGAGRPGEAIAAFDLLVEDEGLRPFGVFHKALALALTGDFDAAEPLLGEAAGGGLELTRQAVIARAQILGQLGRPEEGAAAITDVFGDTLDPALAALRDALAAGETPPFDVIENAAEGMALAYYGVAAILASEAADEVTLVYARLAQALAPDNGDILLLTGGVLGRMGRHDLAVQTLGEVAPDDPAFVAAELGRAEALYASGEAERAIAALESFTRSYPGLDAAQVALGDLLRRSEDLAGAEAAYTRAIDVAAEGSLDLWRRHYLRGIVRYGQDDWPGAEADFRAALALSPDNAGVLNYLGYSLIEEGGDLVEALELIERAVALQPDSGAIVDSLGWAHFQTGDYQAAVPELESAARLTPVDPVVNDHLGDAYWMVGRQREARFQWQRALSFDPEPEEAERIRAKLAEGLDAVLAEEAEDAAGPATVARP